MTFNLDNLKMNVIQTAPNGVVNELTIFSFVQKNNIVSARYSGGKIETGYLVGLMNENKLDFCYCQLQIDGRLDNGNSKCELIFNDEGKILMKEKFNWASRNDDSGENIFKQI